MRPSSSEANILSSTKCCNWWRNGRLPSPVLNGLAIALAENNEIVLRASAGTIKPDVGARIDRDSAFSGACFRTAQIVRCNDTESDLRVTQACRALGARSMVAVPLCGRRRVIGLLEAFSTEPFGFNDTDVSAV